MYSDELTQSGQKEEEMKQGNISSMTLLTQDHDLSTQTYVLDVDSYEQYVQNEHRKYEKLLQRRQRRKQRNDLYIQEQKEIQKYEHEGKDVFYLNRGYMMTFYNTFILMEDSELMEELNNMHLSNSAIEEIFKYRSIKILNPNYERYAIDVNDTIFLDNISRNHKKK